MGNEVASINIPKDVLASIVEAHIQSTIIMALEADKENLIPKMVEAAMKQKVDDSGNLNKDSFYNKHSYVELMVNKALQVVAKEAIIEWVENNKAEVKKALIKALNKNNNAAIMAFMDSINHSVDVKLSCNVNLNRK